MLKFASIGRKTAGAFARPLAALAGVPARAFAVQSVASAESLSKILKAEEVRPALCLGGARYLASSPAQLT